MTAFVAVTSLPEALTRLDAPMPPSGPPGSPQRRAWTAEWRLRARVRMITMYGGRCVCCGEPDPSVLQADHLWPATSYPREIAPKTAGGPTSALAARLVRLGTPHPGISLACANCNFGRSLTIDARCPHAGGARVVRGKTAGRSARLRTEALTVYGSACWTCGESEALFLHLDHEDWSGGQHRKSVGGRSADVLRDLRARGWPPGMRTLCANDHVRRGLVAAWAPS